ncbi:unnamed protein product [Rotaria sp. Silwood1]|nr:unnamed protein product [Rotaria sp. Silwood1]CAF3360474.1 unnamed protein product [Rotaria sp. Silwood1]CAF3395265.1 unnamed protein product [Rotaria sp. Silwood1]CAF3396010.1 unnamed protein product [Rotaria sp. Silwood1]CAF4551712.1 unnamed protein product [Rotaria sp. Silwood1]
MTSIDLDDDLIFFTIDSLDDDDNNDNDHEYCSRIKSDLLTNDYLSVDRIQSTSTMISDNKKMSDITDLLDSTEFNDKQENVDLISTNVLDYLRTHNLQNDQDTYEKHQWETEENYLKYGSKQLSPSDYLARTSLYNRPVAFEKDSRLWARSLLDNFKKSNHNCKSKSSSVNLAYYLPVIKKSSSFDRHVQYVEHLNECNDFPAYLEYLRENRSQLFYTLTDSIDIIDGLIGTVV